MGGSVASRILTVKTTFALSSRVSCVCAFSFVGASFVCMSDLVLFIYSNVAIYNSF